MQKEAVVDVESGHPKRWTILSILILCLIVIVLDNTILNVALKVIQEELSATQSEMEWAINSYTLVFAGLMFTAGVLGDRFGRRRFMVWGLILFGAASILSAFSTNPEQLIATRALMGIGAAMVQPQTLSIITNVFGLKERGKAIGIWAGFAGIGIAIGPVTGGFLLEHFWWGSIFLVNAPFVIIGIAALLAVVPESRDPKPSRLDPLGVLLSIGGITAVVYGIIKGGETVNWMQPSVLIPLLSGLVLIALFVLIEKRSTHPSLDISLFKKPAFTAASVALAVVFFALMGLIFAGTFYLQTVRGFSPLEAGALAIPVSIGILLTAPRSAKTVARFGTKVTVTAGMLIAGASMGSYAFLDLDTPMWAFGIITFVMGLGMGNIMAPATESIMTTVPREKAGAGSAVNNTVRMVGGALGVAILGSVLSVTYRRNLGDDVNVLPADARHEAGESVGGTLKAVSDVAKNVASGQAPPESLAGMQDLTRHALDAFLGAMHTTALTSMAVAWSGAILAAVFLPGKKSNTTNSPAMTSTGGKSESGRVEVSG